MLSYRQLQICIKLIQDKTSYVRISYLLENHHISIRTLQNDINAIRKYVADFNCEIVSIRNKGYLLKSSSQKNIEDLTNSIINPNNQKYSFNDQDSRINYIILTLLSKDTFFPINEITKKLYISNSRIKDDLEKAKAILNKYDIDLIYKQRYGIMAEGKEEDKRRCLIKQNIILDYRLPAENTNIPQIGKCFPAIKEMVTEIFINEKIIVSDTCFQNILIHLSTALFRMMQGKYVQKELNYANVYQHSLKVARIIVRKCCEKYNIKYNEAEIYFLAIEIQGKREYSSNEYVSTETNDFVFNSLYEIRNKYNIDFLNDMDLRMALSLHLVPLLTRLENNKQIENVMTFSIKQKYVLAYDIASLFADSINKKTGYKLIGDEIAYFALHFNLALSKVPFYNMGKKILLITSEKKSNGVLIKQKVNQWFEQEIVSFDIIHMNQICEINPNDYDFVLTTDYDLKCDFDVTPINFFLTTKDYRKIELLMNGYKKADDIVGLFNEKLFFTKNFDSKEEAISFICDKTSQIITNSDELKESALSHEDISNSYYGNLVAIPHPSTFLTDSSFIGVCICPDGIKWNEDGEIAKLILLISIEKDNIKSLSIWYYLSLLIANTKFIQKIINKPTYENFINICSDYYKKLFDGEVLD